MSERQIAVYNQFRNAQDKYTYFLLAAAGAAVALALRETASAPLAWSEIALAAAVLCWGSSFFSGCRHLTLMASSLYSNFQLLYLSESEMQLKLTHPEMIAEKAEALQLAIQRNSSRAERFGKMQFRLLISGAILYIGWHIWEMWVRTPQSLLK
jgi:hypothetical protein